MKKFIEHINIFVEEKFDEFDDNLKIKYHQYRI